MNPNRTRMIVLTGAWGGGKSTLLQDLMEDPQFKEHLVVLPEAAPLVRGMGFEIDKEDFEKHVLEMQHILEEAAESFLAENERRLILTHRGSLDAWAFWCWMGHDPEAFFPLTGTTREGEFARYDAVIFMETTAKDFPREYHKYRREHHRPDQVEAARLESYLEQAWGDHPRFFRIGNTSISWEKKASLASEIIRAYLPGSLLSREEVNQKLAAISYPSNHQYQIGPHGQLEAEPKAAARLRELEGVIPRKPWKSLIDVGCAKGMFLLWASRQFNLDHAIGIEAAVDMVDACRSAVAYLEIPALVLHTSLLECFSIFPPSDLVFVFHCYHYLYFGSEYGTAGAFNHDQIFKTLSMICTDTLVFANPFSLSDEKKNDYRLKGVPEAILQAYHQNSILTYAARYFDLTPIPIQDERPYIIMRKR